MIFAKKDGDNFYGWDLRNGPTFSFDWIPAQKKCGSYNPLINLAVSGGKWKGVDGVEFQETSIIVVRHNGIVLRRLCKWTWTPPWYCQNMIDYIGQNKLNKQHFTWPNKKTWEYLKVLQNSFVAFLIQPPWKQKMESNTGSLSGLSPSDPLFASKATSRKMPSGSRW